MRVFCSTCLLLMTSSFQPSNATDVYLREAESAPIVKAVSGLHELAHDLDVPTIAIGVPPSAYQAMQSEAAELANMVNRELRAWCLERPDRCTYVEHPISSWSKGDQRWAPDGLHFSPEGYRLVGEGLAGLVKDRLAGS